MRMVVIGLLVVACSSKQPAAEDCDAVHGDPSHALKTLNDRHPGDAVGNAEIVERCLAPDGEICDRVAKILPALPALMGRTMPMPEHIASACRSAPENMQSCFLPSYTLKHADECKAVWEGISKELTKPIELHPTP
jgi:hypothetical protein